MCASTNASTVTAKYPLRLNDAPIDDVGLFLSSSKGCAVGAIVSNTTLSTAATTLGTALEIFPNSSASMRKDASEVGNSMLP